MIGNHKDLGRKVEQQRVSLSEDFFTNGWFIIRSCSTALKTCLILLNACDSKMLPGNALVHIMKRAERNITASVGNKSITRAKDSSLQIAFNEKLK